MVKYLVLDCVLLTRSQRLVQTFRTMNSGNKGRRGKDKKESRKVHKYINNLRTGFLLVFIKYIHRA